MLRSTPKDIAAAPWYGLANGIEIAAACVADRRHLPQPVLSRLQFRDRARAGARLAPQRPADRLGRQRVLLRAVRGAASGRPVVRPLRRAAYRVGGVAAGGGWLGVDRAGRRRRGPDRRPDRRR